MFYTRSAYLGSHKMVGWQPCNVTEQILTTMSNPRALQQGTFGKEVFQDCILGGLLLIVFPSDCKIMLLHMDATSIFVHVQKLKRKNGSMQSGEVDFYYHNYLNGLWWCFCCCFVF